MLAWPWLTSSGGRAVPDQRRRLAEANQLNQRVVDSSPRASTVSAGVGPEALTIRQQLLGEGHPDYATGLNNLAAAAIGADQAEQY